MAEVTDNDWPSVESVGAALDATDEVATNGNRVVLEGGDVEAAPEQSDAAAAVAEVVAEGAPEPGPVVEAAPDPRVVQYEQTLAAFQQRLDASEAMNEKLLAALQGLAPKPEPVKAADPFAGLDPTDPDDKIRIAEIKAELAEKKAMDAIAEMKADLAKQKDVVDRQRQVQFVQTSLFNAIEDATAPLGLAARTPENDRIKDMLFRSAAAAWEAVGYDERALPSVRKEVESRVGALSAYRKAAMVNAVRPMANKPEAPQPVRGSGSPTLAATPPAKEIRSFDDPEWDERIQRAWGN